MSLDEAEILQVLMKWRTRLSAAAWTVVRDAHAAEDIFQNAALKAMTREVSFETPSALISWAFITVRHESIDWLRRHRRESVGLGEGVLEMLEREWSMSRSYSSGAKTEALRDCLSEASPTARELLRLRYFEGCSCEEVAERMGIGITAVYKRVSRLHGMLKDCIEGKLRRVAETS